MKLRLFALALLAAANLSFGGNTASSMEKQKVKIADEEIIRKRCKEANLAENFLGSTQFIQIFSGKEMDIDELNNGVDTIYKNMWEYMKIECHKQMGSLAFLGIIPLITPQFNEEFSKIKPVIFKILLKEDYPDLYTQLTGEK